MKLKFVFLFLFFSLIYLIEVDFGQVLTEYFRKTSILILGLLSFFTIIRKRGVKIYSKTVLFLLLYLFYITLSLLWSSSYEEALIGLFGLYICVFSSIVVSKAYEYEDIIYSLCVTLISIVVISWVFYILMPSYTLNKEDFFRFKGITPHSGKLAQCAIVALFILVEGKYIIGGRLFRVICFIILYSTLFLTKMRSFITFYIVIYIFHYFKGKKITIILFPLLFIAYLFFEFGALDFVLNIYQRGSSDITELTGRTELWETLLALIKEKPFFGYGYGAFKDGTIQINSWLPTHGHNLWLHQIYETGLIGNLLFQLVLVSSLSISIKHQNIFGFSYLKYVILFILIGSITGLIVGGLSTPFYGVFIILTLSEEKRIRENVLRYNLVD